MTLDLNLLLLFWGFKSEKTVFDPSQRVNQTYLGKMDTMTFGIGYHHEKTP